jgi:hypothetical protein
VRPSSLLAATNAVLRNLEFYSAIPLGGILADPIQSLISFFTNSAIDQNIQRMIALAPIVARVAPYLDFGSS